MLYDNTQAAPSTIRRRAVQDDGLPSAPGSGGRNGLTPPDPEPRAAQPAPSPQTFAQMQQQGIPRPAPPPLPVAQPATGGPNYQLLDPNWASPPQGPRPPSPVPQLPTPDPRAPQPAPTPVPITPQTIGGGLGSQVQQMLLQLMANPSSYNSDAMRREYESGARGIDDDFSQRTALLKEEMARRGLSDSSIYGGRMSDLNIGRRSAQTELQDRLLQKLADTRAADTRSALGLGMQQYNADADRMMQAAALSGSRADRAAELALNREQLGYSRERDTADRAQREQELLRQFGLDRDRFGAQQDQFNKTFGLDQDRFAFQKQAANDASQQEWWNLLGGLDFFGAA